MKKKENYSFIQETIKDRPVNKRKLFKRTAITALLAVVFGLVACLTFLLIEPVINRMLNPEQISKVEFPEEQKEVLPQELLTEETVAQQEEAQQEAALEEIKQQAIEEAQKTLTTAAEFSVSDYEKIYDEFYNIARECNGFMVTVTGISQREDWIVGTMENEKTTSGMIVADNGAQVLILGDSSLIGSARNYYVRFCDGKMASAVIKKEDIQTGLAIFAVDLSDMDDSTKEAISIAKLGRSNNDQLVGKPVIAIGAPLGTTDSVSYGMITSNGNTLNVTDAVYKILLTDMNMGKNASGVIIGLDKNVLGVICSSAKNIGGMNTIATIGISEIKTLIAKLSNGEDRAYIGIKGMDVTDGAHTEIDVPYGAYVTEVLSLSPAMKAGISNGDVIVRIGNQNIRSFTEYHDVLLSLTPQSNVIITLMRYNGRGFNEIELEVMTTEAE